MVVERIFGAQARYPCSVERLAEQSSDGTIPATAGMGGVVEWLMAPVLKTGRAQALVGSNPTPSAISKNFGSSAILAAIFAFEPGDSNAVRLEGRVTRQG